MSERAALSFLLVVVGGMAAADPPRLRKLQTVPIGPLAAPDYQLDAVGQLEQRIGVTCALPLFYGNPRTAFVILTCPHEGSVPSTSFALLSGGPQLLATETFRRRGTESTRVALVIDPAGRGCIARPIGARFRLICDGGFATTIDRLPATAPSR